MSYLLGDIKERTYAPVPSESGTNNGEVKRTWGTGGVNALGHGAKHWKWNGTSWDEIEKTEYEKVNSDISADLTGAKLISVGPMDGKTGSEYGTLRWPEDIKYDQSDYVLFQFGKYIPPFSRDINKVTDKDLKKIGKYTDKVTKAIDAGGYDLYNLQNLNVSKEANGGLQNIVLPIPQDLSNEIQQVWQGKQFTAAGRAAVAGLAGAQFHHTGKIVENITGHLKGAQTAINTAVLNSIPGVGGNFTFNDVSGSTRGIVLNPNAELMYDSPEMREIGMVFKLVPRNNEESRIIQNIYQTFRKASLPSFGGRDKKTGKGADEDFQKATNTLENNWIRVPNLCKFTFMKGGSTHPHLIQFKPCAMQKVEVNYTADGTYASYHDGAPLSVELTLNFMETKVIFRDDVSTSGASF